MAVPLVNTSFSQFRAILFLVVCCCVVNGRMVKRSDDFNTVLENLQVLVQQQAAVINSLQAKFTALESRVGILSKTVGFSARFSSDNDDPGIPLSHHAILQFDQVVSNAGNCYNPTNGIFTAPVAGYYTFSIVLMEPTAATHPHLSVSIVKNGAVVDQAFVENASGTLYEQGFTNTLLHLAYGDQVWIRQELGDGVRGSYWSVFTGFLVQAE